MRLASWNVNSIRVRQDQVLAWMQDESCDVLALQETKVTDDAFPQQAFIQQGYHVVKSGQKTYNGVAFVSSRELTDVITDADGVDPSEKRLLAATAETEDGPLRLINLYVINGRDVDSPHYQRKLDWLTSVTAFVAQEMKTHQHVLVMGDFNIAPSDVDVYDPDRWRGRILCSEAERAALAAMMNLGLMDSFRHCHDAAGQYSWWDFRGAMFQRGMGLRIDLILASESLREKIAGAGIDVGPRADERPSDHAPVTLDLKFN